MNRIYATIAFFVVSLASQSQVLTFEDPDFKSFLLLSSPANQIARNAANQFIAIDANADGQIQVSEANAVAKLRISSNATINSVVGIKGFVNLSDLYLRYVTNVITVDVSEMPLLYNAEISDNSSLASIDISGCPVLNRLRAWSCSFLTQIDITNCPVMTKADLYSNALTSISFAGTPNLDFVQLGWNELTSVDFSNLPNLAEVDVRNNALLSLDFSANPLLAILNCAENQSISSIVLASPQLIQDLYCYENALSTLPFDQMTSLVNFSGNNNNFTSINLSNSPNLNNFTCHNNLLVSVNIQNGKYENNVSVCPNPLLQYLCVDANQVANINGFLSGCDAVALTAMCNFFPVPNDYHVQGKVHYDTDNNGCDENDPGFSAAKLKVTAAGTSAYFFANGTGEFDISLPEGAYAIAPQYENLSYFLALPSSVNTAFPGAASPLIQDFCIMPNGTHNDLEIVLIPMTPARPGFDVNYRIVYRNKGNQIQSGNITLGFEDAKLDLLASAPASDQQSTNLLTWNFTDLQPSETRNILLTFNVNSPSEIPAVNGGDELTFGATVYPVIGDDTPYDNAFGLKQTVVNSFDPNDKMCLQGALATPAVIGNYVHYLIRFENTGTFAAERVEVTDFIDATKFDLSTLTPLSGSHDFTTRILPAQNKVIFSFENINLPFDDANNDGYFAFKIKTLPSLTVGSTFTNNARIYFDYNLPILTNTASTTIQLLNSPEFDSKDFAIHPNPVSQLLHLQPKAATEIRSLQIYNSLGQLVKTQIGNLSTVDVSDLKSGNYFVKISATNGSAVSKFVKL